MTPITCIGCGRIAPYHSPGCEYQPGGGGTEEHPQLFADLPNPAEDRPAPTRATSMPTERAAARKLRTGTWRARVLEDIALSGDEGRTHYELEALGGRPQTTRTRCCELVRDGWVRSSGRTRSNDIGNDEVVWVLTPDGEEALRRADGGRTLDGRGLR